jgi:hypothetical protein
VRFNLKYDKFDHQQWRAKRHSTQDPDISLAVATENFRIDSRNGKLAMNRWKADIEKKGSVEIIVRDPPGKESVFRRIHFSHEQKSGEESYAPDLPLMKSTPGPHL